MIRPAGKALQWLFSNYDDVSKTQKAMSGLDIGMRLFPDLLGTAINMGVTPGDLGDKLIAGGTQLTMGAGGGLLAGKLSRNPVISGALDFGGSIAGDFASMPVADAMMRGKDKIAGGKGQTPYERLSEEQQKLLAQQIEKQVLQAYGLLPGTNEQYLGGLA